MTLSRRQFIGQAAALTAGASIAGLSSRAFSAAARVVVIGGGFGGATAAKYIRVWAPDVQVTLVERNREFISCPLSNRVLAGQVDLGDLTRGYGALSAKYGIDVIHDEALAIDPEKQRVPSRTAMFWRTID